MDSASNRSGVGRRLAAVGLHTPGPLMYAASCVRRDRITPLSPCLASTSLASTAANDDAELRCLSVSSWWPVCRPTRISDVYWLLVGWCPVAAVLLLRLHKTIQVYHCEHSSGVDTAQRTTDYCTSSLRRATRTVNHYSCCFLKSVDSRTFCYMHFHC